MTDTEYTTFWFKRSSRA